MTRAIVNLAAGDSPAGLILRQKQLIERYEAALEFYADPDNWENGREDNGRNRSYTNWDRGLIAREALGEQVTA